MSSADYGWVKQDPWTNVWLMLNKEQKTWYKCTNAACVITVSKQYQLNCTKQQSLPYIVGLEQKHIPLHLSKLRYSLHPEEHLKLYHRQIPWIKIRTSYPYFKHSQIVVFCTILVVVILCCSKNTCCEMRATAVNGEWNRWMPSASLCNSSSQCCNVLAYLVPSCRTVLEFLLVVVASHAGPVTRQLKIMHCCMQALVEIGYNIDRVVQF